MGKIILHLHAVTALISICLFVTRFIALQRNALFMQQKWVKIIPHINDTCLLIFGITLVMLTQQYPFTSPNLWLTEKLGFLVLYISFGFLAIHGQSFRPVVRYGFFGLALCCFACIVYLVKTKAAF